MYVVAGFNRSTKNQPIASSVFATSGLANCIAVVAINEHQKQASITHYDTLSAIKKSGAGWIEDMDVLRKFKVWLDARTSATKYLVGIGSIWFNVAGDKGPTGSEVMRHALLMGITKTFNYEPILAAACIAYRGGTSLEAMDKSVVENIAGWADKGDEIPYRTFGG